MGFFRKRDPVDPPLVVVVDFDGIIVESAYPTIRGTDWLVVECLKKIRSHGALLVLNTCRQGNALVDAREHCAQAGLVFSAVNANVDHLIQRWGDCRKLGGDIYIDDRDICFSRFRLKWRLILLAMFYPWIAPLLRR